MNDWFRSWHGAPTDNKWLVVARRAGVAPGVVSAIVWALLDYASQAAERGTIHGFDIETYAAFSGFDEEDIEAVIKALSDKGVIGPDGGFTNWQKRQPKREDGSAERSKAWREQKRNENERTRTQANADDQQIREDTDITLADAKDADASAARSHLVVVPKAPVYTDAVHELWGEGVPTLVSMGIPDGKARSMIGKWRQQTRDDCPAVLKAIINARDQRITDPIPFITASLKPSAPHAQHHHKSAVANAFDRLDERLAAMGGS